MLKAQGLRYVRDGQEILANVDVIVEPGESLAVTGPSGSGKTSLLGLLSGLTAPTAGEVYIDGKPLTRFAGPALGVAVVLQGYGLVSLLTAAENIEVALRAAGRPAKAAARTAREVLAQLGLEIHADQLVEELSGGQQQRTAVARALALEPRLLIADEPTAELDPAARAVALARMFEVAINGGSMILATHDPEVAARCDRILDLRAGVLTAHQDQAVATAPVLAQAPAHQLPPGRPPDQYSAGQTAVDQPGPDLPEPPLEQPLPEQPLPEQPPLVQPPPAEPAPGQQPPAQDLRRSVPWRKPAHALPEPLPSLAAIPPSAPAPQPGPGNPQAAWQRPPGAQPGPPGPLESLAPPGPTGQRHPPVPSSGLSAQHERLRRAALPPLHRRSARLREYLDEVLRRAYNALSWLDAREMLLRRTESAGLTAAEAAIATEELAFLRMTRDDLVGFADLGLRLLELHQPMDLGSAAGDPAGNVPRCLSCMWRWPCPTFLTLAEILESGPGSA